MDPVALAPLRRTLLASMLLASMLLGGCVGGASSPRPEPASPASAPSAPAPSAPAPSAPAPSAALWTNFAYTRTPGGALVPRSDTTLRLPAPLAAHEAIVREDTSYWYVRDTGLRYGGRPNMPGTAFDQPHHGLWGYPRPTEVIFGDGAEGDGDYVLRRNDWSTAEGTWKVAVSKLGDRNIQFGDCAGFDGERVLVVDNGVRRVFRFDLVTAAPDSPSLVCTVFPPS